MARRNPTNRILRTLLPFSFPRPKLGRGVCTGNNHRKVPRSCSGKGVAAVRFLRGTLFAEVRIGIRDLRVKSAARLK